MEAVQILDLGKRMFICHKLFNFIFRALDYEVPENAPQPPNAGGQRGSPSPAQKQKSPSSTLAPKSPSSTLAPKSPSSTLKSLSSLLSPLADSAFDKGIYMLSRVNI